MKLTTTQTKEYSFDVELPIFLKRTSPYSGTLREYLAVLSESHYIKMFIIEGRSSLCHDADNQKDFCDAYLQAKEPGTDWSFVTEEEFMSEHERILQSLSLKPFLTEKEVDDLKGINI